METFMRLRGDFTAEDLYDAACACPDARLRGAVLALASLYEGDAPPDVARIWALDPASLSALVRRFNEDGLDGLSGAFSNGE
jgi:hypothetical protein